MLALVAEAWNNKCTMTERPYDDRAESFLQVGDVVCEVATRHCHIDVDDVTHERWRQLMALLREVDTLHDDRGVEADDIIAQLESFDEFADRYPDLTAEKLGGQTHQKLLRRTRQLLKIGAHVASTKSVQRFVALRVNEGRHTAGLLHDSATHETASQPAFEHSFLPAMQSLGIAASTIDSILDARMDARDKKISVVPTAEYYAKLGGATLKHMMPGMAAILNPRIMYEFAVMSKTRLQNRLKHRNSNTTSLRIFRDV